jgi:hypothetical protein
MVKPAKYFKMTDIKLSGIYFLMVGSHIVYIGQTTDLFQRLAAHSRGDKPFTKIRFIGCQIDKLNYYEMRWILRFKPFYNIVGIPKDRAKYNSVERYNNQKEQRERVMESLGSLL